MQVSIRIHHTYLFIKKNIFICWLGNPMVTGESMWALGKWKKALLSDPQQLKQWLPVVVKIANLWSTFYNHTKKFVGGWSLFFILDLCILVESFFTKFLTLSTIGKACNKNWCYQLQKQKKQKQKKKTFICLWET